jgi:hypothetical protein
MAPAPCEKATGLQREAAAQAAVEQQAPAESGAGWHGWTTRWVRRKHCHRCRPQPCAPSHPGSCDWTQAHVKLRCVTAPASARDAVTSLMGGSVTSLMGGSVTSLMGGSVTSLMGGSVTSLMGSSVTSLMGGSGALQGDVRCAGRLGRRTWRMALGTHVRGGIPGKREWSGRYERPSLTRRELA